MELKISSQSHADCVTVTVRGEIDLYTAPQLRSEFVHALDDGAHRLIVDMSRVEFCDSTGLNVLLSAMKRSREKGGDLILVAPNSAVTKLLEVTGLDSVFTIHESTEALSAAGSNASR
ncbi:STAS domain-containing protein [Halostreptopolyspora alba]|uniref:Anti-sigma factor antagonist n=1 Tax=Halostreptopolyspora alba TaxID=2487137 RepID=A0A3N0E662_9ACTN|nr:anti-sigma factor antagonist [Nocardiopsaceae bacterium YIM 96095]